MRTLQTLRHPLGRETSVQVRAFAGGAGKEITRAVRAERGGLGHPLRGRASDDAGRIHIVEVGGSVFRPGQRLLVRDGRPAAVFSQSILRLDVRLDRRSPLSIFRPIGEMFNAE